METVTAIIPCPQCTKEDKDTLDPDWYRFICEEGDEDGHVGATPLKLRKTLAPSFSHDLPDQYRWVDTEWRNVE